MDNLFIFAKAKTNGREAAVKSCIPYNMGLLRAMRDTVSDTILPPELFQLVNQIESSTEKQDLTLSYDFIKFDVAPTFPLTLGARDDSILRKQAVLIVKHRRIFNSNFSGTGGQAKFAKWIRKGEQLLNATTTIFVDVYMPMLTTTDRRMSTCPRKVAEQFVNIKDKSKSILKNQHQAEAHYRASIRMVVHDALAQVINDNIDKFLNDGAEGKSYAVHAYPPALAALVYAHFCEDVDLINNIATLLRGNDPSMVMDQGSPLHPQVLISRPIFDLLLLRRPDRATFGEGTSSHCEMKLVNKSAIMTASVDSNLSAPWSIQKFGTSDVFIIVNDMSTDNLKRGEIISTSSGLRYSQIATKWESSLDYHLRSFMMEVMNDVFDSGITPSALSSVELFQCMKSALERSEVTTVLSMYKHHSSLYNELLDDLENMVNDVATSETTNKYHSMYAASIIKNKDDIMTRETVSLFVQNIKLHAISVMSGCNRSLAV